MANTLTSSLDLLTGLVVPAWRKTCVLPMLVDMQWDPGLKAHNRGAAVVMLDIEDMAATDVVAGYTPNSVSNVTNVARNLTLSYYKEVNFTISGQDFSSINSGILPRSMERAMFALSEAIEASFFTEIKKTTYQAVGTAGTTPFASDVDILREAGRMLTTGKAPRDGDRFILLDEYAMQNAVGLTQFNQAYAAGSNQPMLEGLVRNAFGFNWYESNTVATHTTTRTGTYAVDAAGSIGATSFVVDNGAGALPAALVVGDVLTITGSTQQFTVTSYAPATTEATVGIFPALDQVIADGDAVTVVGSHKMNIAFHRDSIVFASRPTVDTPQTNAVNYRQIPDPLTGVVLDLRIQDYHRETVWSIGCLWGVAVPPRKEAGIVRILG